MSFRIEAAAAKSSTRELAEIHRAACGARDLLDPDARVGEAPKTKKTGRTRRKPRRRPRSPGGGWAWRAFARAGGRKTGARARRWAPRRRGAPASRAPRATGSSAPTGARRAGDLYRPRRSDENGAADDDDERRWTRKTCALRAIFGDGPPRTNEPTTTHDKKRTTTGDDRDILPVSSRLQLELVPAAAAARWRRRWAGASAPGCSGRAPGLGRSRRGVRGVRERRERSTPPKVLKVFPSAVPANTPYVSQAVSVRVRVSPAAFARAAVTAPRRRRQTRGLSRKNVAPAPAHAEHLTLSDHGNARAPRGRTTHGGRVVGPASEEKRRKRRRAPPPPPPARPVGRACSLVVDHDYTVWRVKLLLLEKLAIHPLDMSLFYATYRHDDKRQDLDELEARGAGRGVELENAQTLREAGVPAGARLALFATARRGPDDLAGLEMPLGPVAWETDGGGGEPAPVRSEVRAPASRASRAPPRGLGE